MSKLVSVKEVSAIDQLVAMMGFLDAMGYDNSKLTYGDVSKLKRNIIQMIDNLEDPIPGYIDWETRTIEEGNLPL